MIGRDRIMAVLMLPFAAACGVAHSPGEIQAFEGAYSRVHRAQFIIGICEDGRAPDRARLLARKAQLEGRARNANFSESVVRIGATDPFPTAEVGCHTPQRVAAELSAALDALQRLLDDAVHGGA